MENQELAQAPEKIWNRQFILLFIANGLMYLGQWTVQTLVTNYAKTMGATSTILGIVASAFAVTAILFKIISGPALDQFRRKNILLAALCVVAVAYFGYSISQNIPMLVLFRLLQGAGQAFTATCCLTLAADALPVDKLGEGIGMFSLAQAISQAVAPTLGLAIANYFGFHVTFAFACVMILLSAAMVTQIPASGTLRQGKFKISLDSVVAKEALIPMFILLLLASAFCLINSFLVIYASDMGVSSIGGYFSVYALTLLITRPMVGKLADRLSFVKVAVPAMLCFALSFWLISISRNIFMFLAAAVISAFGYGACQPLVNSLCMKSVPPDRRGAASSTSYVGTDLGNLIGPTLAGVVISRCGYTLMWRVMTIQIFAAIGITLLFRKKISAFERCSKT